MDLESATSQLYAGSPDDFVDRRKALVTEARAAKDRALATAIGKLRKPTRSAWLVNLYAREAPDELAALLELGEQLQAAQQRLSAPDLRRLSAERHTTVAAATERAAALAEARGYVATESVRQEVAQTLQAALADPAIADPVRTGTLVESQSYGGFGFEGFPTPDLSDVEVAGATSTSDKSEEKGEAEQRLQQAEAELSAAAEEAEEATERADQLADRVETLQTELAEAEASEAEARTAARALRKRVSELERAVLAAREAYEAL